jgi:hypothetical protein
LSNVDQTAASVYTIAGFVVAISGVAMYSIPLALIIGGTVLFAAGGLAARKHP